MNASTKKRPTEARTIAALPVYAGLKALGAFGEVA